MFRNDVVKKLLSMLLAITFIFSTFATSYAAQYVATVDNNDGTSSAYVAEADESLTDQQIRALGEINLFHLYSGLVGFEGDYTLPTDDEPVSVIVLFNNQPAQVAQAVSEANGLGIVPAAMATDLAEKDHASFNSDLNELLGAGNSRNRGVSSTAFGITAEYRNAINGVAITVPASQLQEIAEFSSVHAIFPDVEMTAGPVEQVEILGDKTGMAEGRSAMNVDELHDMGITGEGVTVCIIDTGIDYNHPAFEGAFYQKGDPNMPEALKNSLTDADYKNGVFYGRNFQPAMSSYPAYEVQRNKNDPMETTYNGWKLTNYAEFSNGSSFYTAHGTHVAGTIAARDVVGDGVSALGIAPGSKIYSYRALGPYGSGLSSITLTAIEKVVADKPDVVNMSLGAATNDPYYPTSLAINNILVTNPDITFVVAAGNAGDALETIGAPGTSAAAITVANATGATTDTVISAGIVGKSTYNLAPFYMDMNSEFVFDQEKGNYYLTYNPLTKDADNTYNIRIMTKVSSDVEGALSNVGTGTSEEFAALYGLGKNSIMIISRGSPFLETLALAKEYEIGALIIIDHQGSDDLSYMDRGRSEDAIPFFSMSYEDGVKLVADVQAQTGGRFSFNDVAVTVSGQTLQYSSSRGPVGTTYEIKPDVTSHGTYVLSTVPYYIIDTNVEDYTTAYAEMTGTSMASPHVAGVAALLKQYSKRETGAAWHSEEIKARLMNNAYILETEYDYSVNEIGAGYVDALAAATAKSYALVDHVMQDSAYTEQENKTGSISFGFVGVGEEVSNEETHITKTVTIHNTSNTEKTYEIGHRFNTAGANVANPENAEISLSFSDISVTVPANSEETFTVTVNVPEALPNSAKGCYEGYVTINSGNEELSLPFSLHLLVIKELLEEGNYFINRPIISTGDNQQAYASASIDFFYNQSTPGYYEFFLFDGATYDPENFNNGAALGYITTVDGLSYVPGYWYYNNIFNGTYNAFVLDPDTNYPIGYSGTETIVPGYYKIVVQGYTTENSFIYVYDLDLYVDNTPPELAIDGLQQGQYDSVGINEGSGNIVTITGNVTAPNLNGYVDAGLEFTIWDVDPQGNPIDILPRTPDQRYNQVVLDVDGTYYTAGIDVGGYFNHRIDANGNFSIKIDLTGKTLPVKITAYAVDWFSIMAASGRESQYSTGFSPDMMSYGFIPDGQSTNFAYVGSNMTTQSFYIEQEGNNIILSDQAISMWVGNTAELQAFLNSSALQDGDSVSYFESNAPEIVAVANNGNGKATLTGVTDGTATITVHTKLGLTTECEVTVKPSLIAGLDLRVGDYIYLGSMKHASSFTSHMIWGPTINREAEAAPIVWQIMGEEQSGGAGDGYITLLSKYVLDVVKLAETPVSDYYNMTGSATSWGKTIKHYLNGGMWLEYVSGFPGVDLVTKEQYVDPATSFWKNFTASELNAIPILDNEIPQYNNNLVLLPMYTYLAPGERFFLPWTTLKSDLSLSVYWSMQSDLSSSNAMLYQSQEIQNNPSIVTTYRNGNAASYWTEKGIVLINIGADTIPLASHTLNINQVTNNYHGVRPGSKLNPEDIVFAYEINDSGDEGTAQGNGYLFETNSDNRYFKLSVLGANGGSDIAEQADTGNTHNITAGNQLTIQMSKPAAGIVGYDTNPYKIVDKAGNLVKYGESEYDGGAFTLNTSALAEGVYDVYFWSQKNNAQLSNETSAVSHFTLTVSKADNMITSISLNNEALTLSVDGEFKLIADILPASAAVKTLIWSSSNNAVATVEQDGTVKAHSAGTATITASAADGSGITAECQITVVRYVTSITLKDSSSEPITGEIAVSVGEPVAVTAEVEPGSATDKAVVWASGDESIVTIDGGVITYVGDGTTFISATAADGSGVAAFAVVVAGGSAASYVPVDGVSLNKADTTLAVGAVEALVSTINPGNATVKDVTWTSSNVNVATVDSSGNITAVSPGRANITVKTVDGEYTAICAVTVTASVTSVGIDKAEATVRIGQSVALTAVIFPGTATADSIQWSINPADEEYVELVNIDQPTVSIIGKKDTSAPVTVTLTVNGTYTATCDVTVSFGIMSMQIVADGIENGVLTLVHKNTQKNLSLLLNGSTPGNNADVKWTSSNTGVATVNDAGIVTAAAKGTATITATSKDGSGEAASITVKVETPVTSLEMRLGGVSDAQATIPGGVIFMRVGSPYQSVSATVTPADALDNSVTWTIGNAELVEMATTSTFVYLYPLAVGETTLRATSNDNPSVYQEVIVKVLPAVTDVAIYPDAGESLHLMVGDTMQLSYEVFPAAAKENKAFSWSVRPGSTSLGTTSGTVSISSDGVVTALKAGMQQIVLTMDNAIGSYEGKSYYKTIVVTAPAFTVAYSPNGGTGEVVFTEPETNHTIKAANIFAAPTGMEFDSWNTSPDGLGTKYTPGTSLELTGNLVLYAIWRVSLISITAPAAVEGVASGAAATAAGLGLPEYVTLVTTGGDRQGLVSWNVAGSGYNPGNESVQSFTVEGVVTLPANVKNPLGLSLTVTVNVTVLEKTINPVFVSVVLPDAIIGVVNGTAKTAEALGLPESVMVNTTSGKMMAGVVWNVNDAEYDPGNKAAQTFNVTGTVTIPAGVESTEPTAGVAISVTVDAAAEALISVMSPAPITGLANGTAKTVEDLGLPETIEIETNFGHKDADVIWIISGCSYNPALKTGQAFTVTGIVSLPAGVVNTGGVSLEVSVTVTVKAEEVSPEIITVTFNANGGSGAMTAAQIEKGSVYTLPYCNFTRSGHSFTGWRIGNTGVIYAAGYSFTVTEDIALYAQWVYNVDTGEGEDTDISRPRPTTPGTGSGTTAPDTTPLNPEETPLADLDSEIPFTDVTESNWYYEHIAFVYANGLMNGVSADRFNPNGVLTRAMMATILYRFDDSPDVGFLGIFGDVQQGTWYADAVEWAAEMGVAQGDGTNFMPDNAITREQLAVMLYNYAKAAGYQLPEGEIGAFADAESIHEWAEEAVAALHAAGVISGRPGNIFDPRGSATRAEVAAMLQRFIELVAE